MLDFLFQNKDLWFIPLNIVGILLNMHDKRACFLFWWPTNFLFVYFSFERANYSMVIMQLIYGFMNLWGLYHWRHKPWLFSRKESPK